MNISNPCTPTPLAIFARCAKSSVNPETHSEHIGSESITIAKLATNIHPEIINFFCGSLKKISVETHAYFGNKCLNIIHLFTINLYSTIKKGGGGICML